MGNLPRNEKCRRCREQCCNNGFAVITILYGKWLELFFQLFEREEKRDGRMQEYSFYYGESNNDRFDISIRNPLLDKNSDDDDDDETDSSTVDPFLRQHYESHRIYSKSHFSDLSDTIFFNRF